MRCSSTPGSSAPNRLCDADLVTAAVDGDKDAFAALVLRHRPMVGAVTGRLVDDQHLAADVVQEALVVAMVSLHRLRHPDRFGSWLCGIALNIGRRWLRQTRTVDPLPAEPPAHGPRPDELAEASLVAEQVRDAVAGLAPGQRQATLLFYLQGLSYRETAAELGISVGAVKARLHQARNALAPHVATYRQSQEEPPMSTSTAPTHDWVDVSVADVRASGDDPADRRHVVLLEDDRNRQLPIWIGLPEAISLALSLEAEEMPRPLTYEFAAGLLDAASAKVVEVRLTELVAGVYYAVAVVKGSGGRRELDARPSDALNLALVTDAPIRVAAAIFDDPKAMDRPEWRDYADSAAHLADFARRRMDRHLARDSDPPDA